MKTGLLPKLVDEDTLKRYLDVKKKQDKVKLLYKGPVEEVAKASAEDRKKKHANVDEVREKLYQERLNSKEYKNFRKAERDLEVYEEQMLMNHPKATQDDLVEMAVKDKKYKALSDRYTKAKVEERKRAGEMYIKSKDDILSAKLRDLNLPDTNEFKQLYAEYYKTKAPFDEDYRFVY